ncbi:MAG: hypothetical protein OXG39_13125 [Chloroflexi bacterium]|nr:hypothetical protein [Chloroflexota bacterium]
MRKQFVLFEPGGRQISGYSYGKLVERRYIDVVRTGIESPDRDEFIQLVEQQQLTEEELSECRIGYVDENGVGTYSSWEEFLDPATAEPG